MYISFTDEIFYLDVENINDIKIVNDEKISFVKRLSGSRNLTKRQNSENLQSEILQKVKK